MLCLCCLPKQYILSICNLYRFVEIGHLMLNMYKIHDNYIYIDDKIIDIPLIRRKYVNFIINIFHYLIYTLSARAGSALVWHSEVARSRLTQCSKSCDLQPALQCAIRGAQGVLLCVGWGVRPVNWIYRL